jgi:hypothetical protein
MTLQTSNFKTYIMKINTFEEIFAWQKAKDLTIQIIQSLMIARILDLGTKFKEPQFGYE